MPDIKVTVVFTAYKQEAFVREAVRSVLAQDYTPLEIILSDDCSPDATFEIIKEEAARYTGPHTLVLNRYADRVPTRGAGELMSKARGSFVVLAHGDDRAFPHRVRRLVENAVRMRCTLVTSNAFAIDAEGRRIGMICPETQSRSITLEDLAKTGWNHMLLGATFAYHRRLREAFGPPDRLATYRVQDHATPVRAALLNGIWYDSEPLMEYRYHSGNVSARTADRTSTPEVARATIAMHELGGPVAMLKTFDQATRGKVLDARLRAARAAFERRVAEYACQAVIEQNRLRLAGMQQTWRPAAEIEAQPMQPGLRPRPPVLDAPPVTSNASQTADRT